MVPRPSRAWRWRNQARNSSSRRIVIRVFPLGTETTAPRFALRKSYSRFMMFLILSSLSGCGRACRDQAHTFSPPDVNHDEEEAKCIFSQSDPPLLFF